MKLNIHVKNLDNKVICIIMNYLKKSVCFLKKTKVLFISNIAKTNLPTKRKEITVLRSPHIDKKAREQFQIKFSKRLFQIHLKNFYNINIKFFLLKILNCKFIKMFSRSIVLTYFFFKYNFLFEKKINKKFNLIQILTNKNYRSYSSLKINFKTSIWQLRLKVIV